MNNTVFFCGIGGSGMLPLALIVQSLGAHVAGSDRSYDQGRNPDKFNWLDEHGISLYPQDGSGVTESVKEVIVSTAVESTIPDVIEAKKRDIPVISRATLLARLFNNAHTKIAISGTSGKSTVTGMLAFVLRELDLRPTVMNGAVMKDYASFNNPYVSALVGGSDIFVTEADESDGSIALYNPDIAVITNIALDHKKMDELRTLFGDLCARSKKVVLNMDHPECIALAEKHRDKVVPFSLLDVEDIQLSVPGDHNKSNAAAALAVIKALGLDVKAAQKIITGFSGVKRRLDKLGTENGITVIDDFAHNPDKVLASLSALKQEAGRLLVLYQPHGYGMLKLTGADMGKAFAEKLGDEDLLFLTQPIYFGGTVDKSVGVDVIAQEVPHSRIYQNKEKAFGDLTATARPGDRIVVMGARDDTLTEYGYALLNAFASKKQASP